MATAPRIPSTKRQFRDQLSQAQPGELRAIEAIDAAYMALNAAGPSAYGNESHLAWQDGPTSPMALVAKAAQAALSRLPGVGSLGAERIWHHMVDNGCGAEWNYELWIKGEI